MNCDLCGGKTIKIVGSLPFKSKAIGNINVPGVSYSKCASCHDILVDFDQSIKMSNYFKEQEKKAIESIPISEFVSLNEAADILEISKQAFSKNPRVKRGFVYSAVVGGRQVFYRKSIEQFKRSGDGRILIELPEKPGKKEITNKIIYIVSTQEKGKAPLYERPEIYGFHTGAFKNCLPTKKYQKSNYVIN